MRPFDRDAFRATLQAACNTCGIPLLPQQLDQATSYAVELLLWNDRAGLTRLTEPDDIALRHFLESFLAVRLLPATAKTGIDVGSGGGFPGLAALIVAPQVSITLLEPRQAKAAFLRHVARLLELEARVSVQTCRLEDYEPPSPAEFAMFRGVRVTTSDLLRVLKPGACVVFYSGEGTEGLEAGLARCGAVPGPSVDIPGRRGSVLSYSLPG